MATGNGEAFPQESHAIDPIDLSAWRQMESELPADWEPISLQQTSEKDELAQVRLQNASAALSRSEEHTSELQSLMRISYAVFCLKKKHIQILQLPRHIDTTKKE